MTLDSFEERFADRDLLDDFTLEESSAFADLAILVVLADREVSDDELEAYGEQLLALAFDDESQVEELYGGRGETVRREAVVALEKGGDAVEDFIRERTARIEGGAHREAALEMLATLAYADGLEPGEEDVCHQIGRAFGFPSEMVEVTFSDVRDG